MAWQPLGGSCDPWALVAAILFSHQQSESGCGTAGHASWPQGVAGGTGVVVAPWAGDGLGSPEVGGGRERVVER